LSEDCSERIEGLRMLHIELHSRVRTHERVCEKASIGRVRGLSALVGGIVGMQPSCPPKHPSLQQREGITHARPVSRDMAVRVFRRLAGRSAIASWALGSDRPAELKQV
jgi:hypothetical protein